MYVCPACGAAADAAGVCDTDGTDRVFATDALSGRTIGPYRVATVIGAGGMGEVYRAVHPTIGSHVAIKVLAAEYAHNAESVDRFFAEARAVNLIRHENIVNILDFARLGDGRPYIVMELIEGQPLSRWACGFDVAPLRPLARIVCDVLAALEATHACDIVHRDLKPHNVLVTPEGRGKVLDFGVAKLRPEALGRQRLTQSGALVGTPEYMAPEQALERPVDGRTDLYAVGVVLFECATGTRPFAGSSLVELLHKQAHDAPPRPSDGRPDIAPAYEQVILTALAKAPADRFSSARAMRAALAAAAGLDDNAPATTRTNSPPGRDHTAATATTVKAKGLSADAPSSEGSKARLRRALAGIAMAVTAGATALIASSLAREPDRDIAAARSVEPAASATRAPGSTARAAVDASVAPAHSSATDAPPGAGPPAIDAARRAPRVRGHDVTSYVRSARARAQRTFGDAVLVGIEATGMSKTGRIQLSSDASYRARYKFISPSLAKPAATVRDVRARSRCAVWVTVTAAGVISSVATDSCGERVVVPVPQCSGRQVWQRASAALGVTSRDLVTARYERMQGAATARWRVTARAGATIVNDTCD